MMSVAPTAAPLHPTHRARATVLMVLGGLTGTIAAVLLLVAVAFLAVATQRDGDGYFTTSTERFSTSSYALTYESLELDHVSEAPNWIADRLGSLRINATSPTGERLFVGVGREADVDRYLAGVAHDEMVEVDFDTSRQVARTVGGDATPLPPGHQRIWAASAFGPSPSVSWKLAEGDWTVVLMNAEAERAVVADVELGAKAGWVVAVGFALAGLGILVGAAAATMLYSGIGSSAGADANSRTRGDTAAP